MTQFVLNPKAVKCILLSTVLIVVLNYGRIANDFAAGRLAWGLDAFTACGIVIASIFFCRSASIAAVENETSSIAVSLFGILSLCILPFTFATVFLTMQQYSNCITGNPNAMDMLYFSFVNFTTLGFGDFAPLGFCKAVSAIEAVTGYLFLGIFSALLVASKLTKGLL